ncbi:MAG: SUMF1/EgtB/PvdO family nonheme iron enzyme [Kofleriaceae bacterium]
MRLALLVLVGCGHDASQAHVDAKPIDAAMIDAPMIDAAPQCTANGIPGSCIEASECIDSRSPTAGLCPGPAAIECCTPRFADGVTCDPNAMPDPNASLPAEAAGDAGCPAGMAHVDTFCIDRYEASIEGQSPFRPPTMPIGHAVSKSGAVPQGNISQVEATSACAAAGKRLCTDTEWLRACRGPANNTYPYGSTREPGVCNDARAVHPAVELYGTTDAWIYSHLDSPCLGQEANGLAPSGAHTGCVTAEGIYDMMGNIHEWTSDPAGTFRGGYYVDTVLNGNGCLYVTTAHDINYSDYSTGFRCCADPS